MTDNDHATIEALLAVRCPPTQQGYTGIQAITYIEGARAILDAIRAGKVPGVRDPRRVSALYHELECQVKILHGVLDASREVGRQAQKEADGLRAEVEREKARADKAEKRLADYDARLTAVMAPDFKCWHQNSRDEWPEVAAWVINNLRQQIEVETFHADKATAERDQLRAEVERLKADLEYAGSAGHVANARRAAADEARAEARKRICDLEDDARALEAQRDAAILDRGDAEVRCAEALEMARKLGEALEQATAVINRANAAIAAQPAPAKPQKENHHD